MSSLRRVPALLAAVLVSVLAISLPRSARAQLAASVSVPAQGVKHSVTRTGFRTNTQINFADCNSDDIITFSVNLANRGTYPLQIWAGNNSCTAQANRNTTTLAGCWLLYSATPNANSFTVDLHVRDILWGQTAGSVVTGSTTATGGSGGSGGTADAGSSGTGGTATGGTGGDGTAGTATTTTTTVPTGTLIKGTGVESCDDKSGIQAATSLAVNFMLVDLSNANAVIGTGATWTAQYKLNAPNPPDTVSATVGDSILPLHFNYANNQSTDTTINGYQFFCDPPPGPGGLVDAGIVPVATDAGVVTPSCATSQLEPGKVADSIFKCGSASVSATAGNATGLVNGVSYNVGVSATDTFENVGKLSTLTCQVPQPVDGFFKAYRAAGGTGGGGFCSFSVKREPLPLIALLGIASCLAFRRRRAA